MSVKTRPVSEETRSTAAIPAKTSKGSNRRTFLGQVSSAAAVIAATATVGGPLAARAAGQEHGGGEPDNVGRARARRSFNNRVRAAEAEFDIRTPEEVTNGDEQRYSNRIGNFSKG